MAVVRYRMICLFLDIEINDYPFVLQNKVGIIINIASIVISLHISFEIKIWIQIKSNDLFWSDSC